ncbi:hypothetical protein JAB9_24120 [Janthinobacterium sp. HH107]|uniref:DUF2199 domain-containing protein n=1 Tax=Janthinobacterium sp. HH107 TaxID=1537279 RepID=UPI0008751AA5|nr:DUF2199 domain-containing protein [Janthinobacterium sp. HH107]OEZ97268.1 hypothetical protein JAB9_24120 [Janthinobacterium sp. HH107]
MRFSFLCRACGETHTGMPSFGADAPWLVEQMAPAERETRCQLDSDACIVDEKHCFVRATIDIPVHGSDEPFSWGVWVSLSSESFDAWDACFNDARRTHIGPFFGWLSTQLPVYPATLNLKTRVHLRDNGMRPYLELEPTGHPLAVEQRDGITAERVAELYVRLVHDA